MVKKLRLLLPILLLSSTIFSQKDTNKICFDYDIAKKIAVDLVKGDSAIAELDKTNKLVFDLNEKSSRQDIIIKNFEKKDANYILQIQNYNQIGEQRSIIIKGLETDVSKLQKSNNRLKKSLKWLGGGFVVVLTPLIILLVIR
jgi:D-hexose-6-phosphate mutarotase